MKPKTLRTFFNDQLSCWPLACNNFRELKNVTVRDLAVNGLDVKLQFNPGRIVSSAAKTDAVSLKARQCFLCPSGRFKEQIRRKFEGRKGKKYDILVNPYPIFPEHYVIALDHHSEQSVWRRYVDMLDMARTYGGYTFFYNGPKCGASAPDHHHFQACPRGSMPLELDVDMHLDNAGGAGEVLEYLTSVQDAELYHYRKFTTGVFVLKSRTAKSAAKLFYRLLDCAPLVEGDSEPRFNLFSYHTSGEYRSIVVFRSGHRSHHYFSDGPDHLTMSPGCADMGGVFIVPDKADFDKLDRELLSELVSEVSLPKEAEELIVRRLVRTQPNVSVGIMSSAEIEFEIFSDGAGPRKARFVEGKIEYDGALYDELFFGSQTLSTMFAEPTFMLHDVTIGKGFHWERRENQKFAGALKLIVENQMLTAVNVVGVEDYLLSVISSEMRASASEEFLKVHAVISRSWLMAMLHSDGTEGCLKGPSDVYGTPALVSYLDSLRHDRSHEDGVSEYVKWYDREDHRNYDVCADDHCQRYQGLTRAVGENVRKAVDATWGQYLEYDGKPCDARFSKCCGGVMEEFGTCWEDKDVPYLRALPDTAGHEAGGHAFCDTDDIAVLSQVLNDYDLETKDFYSWTVEYGRDELSELISGKSGVNIGRLLALEPLERGASGRICKLKVVGSEMTLVVGKELEIRKILSESHLKSSAFDVEYRCLRSTCLPADAESAGWDDCFDTVVLHGHGWGHGVGLCQIGAAVMASKGYGYRQILSHYYPGVL